MFFQRLYLKERNLFNGKIIPKPVITTQGLCFALNARSMKDVFSNNNYIDKFESVFGENDKKDIMTGEQHLVELEMDMQSEYLTDQTHSDQSRNIWYKESTFFLLILEISRLGRCDLITFSWTLIFLGLESIHQACSLICCQRQNYILETIKYFQSDQHKLM